MVLNTIQLYAGLGPSPRRGRIANEKPPRGAIWVTLILIKVIIKPLIEPFRGYISVEPVEGRL